MMYQNKLAVAIKTNGKVLREFKDTVYVPFGSEYSVLIKNLESKRVIVNVFIDGDNVAPGGLALNAGQEIDLERSIKNGNLMEGNRFKFIERTGNIEQHRGVKLEDGLVRIEYQFERVQPQPVQDWHYHKHDYQKYGTPRTPSYYVNLMNGPATSSEDNLYKKKSATRGIGGSSVSGMSLNSVNMASATSSALSAQSMNDVGITVPGSHSGQKFSTASWFPTETERHVMILKLLGETADNKPILAPVTVKAKQKCDTCGRNNKATAKFCTECGTALTIYA